MANNSKFDSQLDRMQYLMGYRVPTNESKRSNKVEYHTLGADNKVYGILKEGSMYYIMTTEQGKETIAESYSYINGFNYRNENGYKSYNEATKQLELKMISLNEAYHKHEDVSTVDTNRGRKNLAVLTEAARKELDRMHQIFENSQTIGKNNTGDPESKGNASAENTTKNNAPFEKKAEANLDKDPKFNGTVEGATPDNKEVKNVDSDLQSDKMKKHGDANQNPSKKCGFKDAHDDLDGEGVADKHPKGAKSVKMNEGFEPDFEGDEEMRQFAGPDLAGEIDDDPELGLVGDDELSDEALNDFIGDEEPVAGPLADEAPLEDEEPVDELPEDELSLNEELEELINEFEETEKAMHGEEKNVESKIEGPDKVMDGPHGGLDVQGWNDEKINEAINRIVESVAEKLCGENKEEKAEVCQKCGKEKCECKKTETLQEAIDRIVAEEVQKLDAWGKHPRYRKQPMSTPANKEVLAGTAEKDWNDDSAKGEQPYGQKIGSSDPFEKVVDLVLDNIKAKLSEGKKSKKA